MEIGRNSWGFTALVIALYAFLLAPVLLVVPISFSNDPFLAFPPQSWGIKYYLRCCRTARRSLAPSRPAS